MAKVKISEKEAARSENIQQTVSKTDQFFTQYKNLLWGILAAILLVGLCVLAFDKFVRQPKCADASEQMYPAEQNFIVGNYELALNGDENVYGFTQVIEEYGRSAGTAVYFYAGVCELQLGNYDGALSYLKSYKGKDTILSARVEACKGDAYVGLENYGAALSCFQKAAAIGDNVFAASYIFKAGLCQEKLGDNKGALASYKLIKDKYPQSMEAYDIDKYIAKVAE